MGVLGITAVGSKDETVVDDEVQSGCCHSPCIHPYKFLQFCLELDKELTHKSAKHLALFLFCL